MKYRLELEGLRGIAVLAVVLFHANVPGLSGGYVGVDVFFVISGYLITSVLVTELDNNTFSLFTFFIRRVRRLVPALLLVMLATLPFAWLNMSPTDLRYFSQSLIAVPLFVSNILFYSTNDYFDTESQLRPLLHTWSLAVEAQYYLIAPFFLIFTRRLTRRWLLTLIACIAMLSLGAAQWCATRHPTFNFYMLPTRMWELMIGAIVALLMADKTYQLALSPRVQQLGSLLGIGLILAAIIEFDDQTTVPGLLGLIPTLGCAIYIFCATDKTWIGKLLSHKAIVTIGLISYSAYLWHQPFFAFARLRSIDAPNAWLMAGLVLATFVVAYFSTHYVEEPFRNRARISQKTLLILCGLLTVFFCALGTFGLLQKGVQTSALNPLQTEILSNARVSNNVVKCSDTGSTYPNPADACQYFGSHITWAVIGDSHMSELAFGLAEALQPFDIGLKQYSFSGCAPTYMRKDLSTPCSEWTARVMDYVLHQRELQTVVLSYRLNLHIFGNHSGFYPKMPDTTLNPQRQAVWLSFVGMVDALDRAGKRVIVVLQAPELPRPIEQLIFRLGQINSTIPGVTREWWNKRNEFVYTHLKDLPANVEVIDPADLLCNTEVCFAIKNKIPYYMDDNHLIQPGISLITKALLEKTGTPR
jgi:peptidoglycan/LPS O-acetylase OafA/YrhL